jgi:hypothetical protein
MLNIKEVDISSSEERLIVTGLIVSTEFHKKINGKINLEYFTNSYLRTLATWSTVFFEEHKRAPFKHINDIFLSYGKKLKPAERELIDDLLTSLAGQYSGEDINVDYILNETEEYFRKRELEIHINNISILKDNGDIAQAEEEIRRFNRVQIQLDESIYINPGDQKTRERIYLKRDEKKRDFFQLPGDIGKFLGNWSPGDVVGITGAAKRGKSHMLVSCQRHAVFHRLQVLKFSIEMDDVQELERLDKSFIPSIDGPSGMYKYPVFDCLKNQIGDCGERLSSVIVKEDAKSPTVENPDHVVCTKCRDNRMDHKRFVPSVYMKEIYRKSDDRHTMLREMKHWNRLLDKYCRIVVRPKYSLTYDLMMRDIEIMASRYHFIPKIILLDYVDILKIQSKHDDFKKVDEQWELLQQVAGATGCLVVTPTQADREGHKVETLHTTNQAGFYGKSRHVNVMTGINQMPSEKRIGLYRINIMDSRSSFNDSEDTCLVLQDLKTGQMMLDSYWANKFQYYIEKRRE